MKKTIEELKNLITDYYLKLMQLAASDFVRKDAPEKWSRKQELGHLIDSAHNNLRRFIVGQYEPDQKILYDQNFWVDALVYDQQPSENLAELWKLLNLQIVQVLQQMPEEKYENAIDTGKNKTDLHTLEWLAADYVAHLKHHLHHILQLEAIPY
jgi:hypothetical protein